MKEIKVKILGQCGTVDGLYCIEVKPLEKMYGPLNAGKTYKLVEDEPNKLPGFKGGKFPKGVLFETDDTKVEEWIKANPNALNTLKELVDKATPKKPTKYKTIHHSIEDIILYKCQCGCCLSYAYNFCPKCGQAIKWGDDS